MSSRLHPEALRKAGEKPADATETAATEAVIPQEALEQQVQDLASLQKQVVEHVATRREALKQEVLQLVQ